jgi:integral membrane sensor domain MASE1
MFTLLFALILGVVLIWKGAIWPGVVLISVVCLCLTSRSGDQGP